MEQAPIWQRATSFGGYGYCNGWNVPEKGNIQCSRNTFSSSSGDFGNKWNDHDGGEHMAEIYRRGPYDDQFCNYCNAASSSIGKGLMEDLFFVKPIAQILPQILECDWL